MLNIFRVEINECVYLHRNEWCSDIVAFVVTVFVCSLFSLMKRTWKKITFLCFHSAQVFSTNTKNYAFDIPKSSQKRSGNGSGSESEKGRCKGGKESKPLAAEKKVKIIFFIFFNKWEIEGRQDSTSTITMSCGSYASTVECKCTTHSIPTTFGKQCTRSKWACLNVECFAQPLRAHTMRSFCSFLFSFIIFFCSIHFPFEHCFDKLGLVAF